MQAGDLIAVQKTADQDGNRARQQCLEAVDDQVLFGDMPQPDPQDEKGHKRGSDGGVIDGADIPKFGAEEKRDEHNNGADKRGKAIHHRNGQRGEARSATDAAAVKVSQRAASQLAQAFLAFGGFGQVGPPGAGDHDGETGRQARGYDHARIADTRGQSPHHYPQHGQYAIKGISAKRTPGYFGDVCNIIKFVYFYDQAAYSTPTTIFHFFFFFLHSRIIITVKLAGCQDK